MSTHDNGSARNQGKSTRALERELKISHTSMWRWKLMAEIPEEEFEAILAKGREGGKMPSTREIANYARRRRNDVIPDDYEHCPHCGEPIRKRS